MLDFHAVALLVFALVCLPARPASAAITDRRIDDTNGDSVTAQKVIYRPSSGVWNSGACDLCAIKPDPQRASAGTWTEATYFKQSQDTISATMSFTGTAISVYFILANNVGRSIVTKTAVNFTLDNSSPELYEHEPDMSKEGLEYDALVFSRSNLQNIHHSLVISTSGIQEQVYVNFDYAVYTHEDAVSAAPNLPSQPSPTGSLPSSTNAQTPDATPQVRPNSSQTTSANGSTNLGTPSLSATISAGARTSDINFLPTGQNEKSSVPVGAIAGGVVGGLVVIALLILGIIFIRRRRGRNDKINNSLPINPFGDEAKGASALGSYTPNHMQAGTHGRNISNASGVVPFPLRGPSFSTVQLSDTVASDIVNPNDAVASTAAASFAGTQSSKGRMEDLRRARQHELEQRLQTAQQEMMEILSDINNHTTARRPLPVLPGHQRVPRDSPAPSEDDMSVNELKETLRRMRLQVEYLQQQQHSAWAQGLSDDPPPGYSPTTRMSVVNV